MPADQGTDAAKQPIKLAYYLPFGEMLRVFLDQQYIAGSDLRILLRERGVFLGENEKSKFIPPLAFATVTPGEFETLLERQRTREDSFKGLTQFVKWSSARSLLDALPSAFTASNLVPEGASYQVTSETGFQPVEGSQNHVRLEFKIERADLHKDWTKGGATYDGKVEIEKIGDGDSAQLVITSTAPETKEIGKKITRAVTDAFKQQGDVNPKEEPSGVQFDAFTNEERVRFLLSFTAANADELRFEAITDYDLGPDEKLVMPDDIKAFVERVTTFQLHGDELQGSFFIQNTAYHAFVVPQSDAGEI